MSTSTIAIVDYQMGNLRSVQKALEHVGQSAVVTSDPDQLAGADKLILPGVGAFGDAIREIRLRHLDQPIVDAIQAGKPFLGICLGLQLLFETGYEGRQGQSSGHAGLGVLPGTVERFENSAERKVPHMGWNQVHIEQPACPLLEGVPTTAHFYFVHSYYAAPARDGDCWLSCDYGLRFCASVWRDNLFATQFHPEKSQTDGLQMLKNFAEL